MHEVYHPQCIAIRAGSARRAGVLAWPGPDPALVRMVRTRIGPMSYQDSVAAASGLMNGFRGVDSPSPSGKHSLDVVL
jgi:hypothetical protein